MCGNTGVDFALDAKSIESRKEPFVSPKVPGTRCLYKWHACSYALTHISNINDYLLIIMIYHTIF